MFTAIITGGAQGIGKAISQKPMKEGVFVFVLDNDPEAPQDFKKELPDRKMCNTVLCDVSLEPQLKRTIESIDFQKPSLRYLLNNAAISRFKSIEDLDLDEWNQILNVNLTSYFLTVKYLCKSLKRNHGSIVNLCSTQAFMSEPDRAYSASVGEFLPLHMP